MELIVLVSLLCLVGVTSWVSNRNHFRRILQRETELSQVLTFSHSQLPAAAEIKGMACGSVVMGIDYFAFIASAIKGVFGGQLVSIESHVERVRREALIRLKQNALEQGGNMVFNIRSETAQLGGKRNQESGGNVEIFVYGTAVYVHQTQESV